MRRLFVFALMFSVILTACGGDDDNAATATPLPSQTPAPTAVPLPMQDTLVLTVASPGDLASEAVTLQNLGPVIDLTGWQIVGPSGQTFTFPAFRMTENSSVTIFSRVGTMTPRALFWGSQSPLWSAGSTLTLLNPAGQPQSQATVSE